MAAITVTVTQTTSAEVQDARPTDHHRSTAKARYIGPPAIDAKGEAIPYPKRWGYSSKAFSNGELRSTMFVVMLIGLFTAWNQTQTAYRLYDYMHVNFTSFQINFYATYFVSFLVYWTIAGLFAFVDLTGRPRFLFKYKVQPFQRVDGREYMHIAKVALRNFTVVVIPLVYVRATLTPARIDPATLEGPWATVGNLFFNLFCTELGFYFM